MNSMEAEICEAEIKAIESLAKYKFMMFGYWASIWVHLNRINRISGDRRPNPFKKFVDLARLTKEVEE